MDFDLVGLALAHPVGCRTWWVILLVVVGLAILGLAGLLLLGLRSRRGR